MWFSVVVTHLSFAWTVYVKSYDCSVLRVATGEYVFNICALSWFSHLSLSLSVKLFLFFGFSFSFLFCVYCLIRIGVTIPPFLFLHLSFSIKALFDFVFASPSSPSHLLLSQISSAHSLTFSLFQHSLSPLSGFDLRVPKKGKLEMKVLLLSWNLFLSVFLLLLFVESLWFLGLYWFI